MTELEEAPLRGGWVTEGVVRVGDTVRRPPGPNSSAVQALLVHLEHVEAPRFLGYDEQGRETLSFIGGDVPSDCRAILWSDDQLVEASALLRRFHDATAGTDQAGDREVVCHKRLPVPGTSCGARSCPSRSSTSTTSQLASGSTTSGTRSWKHLNLGLIDLAPEDQWSRLRVMTESYGAAPDDGLLRAIERAQERMRLLIEASPPGPERDEALAQHSREQAWLSRNGRRLVG